MKIRVSILLAMAGYCGACWGAPQTFDFKDPKGVNNVVFKTDAPLESINGSASGISGSVTFDAERPGAAKGKIVVLTESLIVPNSTMLGHLRSDKWLDAAKNPEITFEVKELKNVKTEGDVTTADAAGAFTLKGVSKEMTIPVKLTYLKGKLGQRVPNANGDLLVIRSQFKIKRGDFNIMAGQAEDKVSNDIELTLSIAGASAKP